LDWRVRRNNPLLLIRKLREIGRNWGTVETPWISNVLDQWNT
jgi:hypothetical protein